MCVCVNKQCRAAALQLVLVMPSAVAAALPAYTGMHIVMIEAPSIDQAAVCMYMYKLYYASYVCTNVTLAIKIKKYFNVTLQLCHMLV
jgi:hypothetical protein